MTQSVPDDRKMMQRAIALGVAQRAITPPNPWVGCVIATTSGATFEGATEAVGGRHSEVVALHAAGESARGATVYVTLEPCAHQGRTPPCVDALISAGVSRVVVGIEDPDKHVAGQGIARLKAAGIAVQWASSTERSQIEQSLAPYLVHRRTGRPYVVCKFATSIDGRTAAPDGTSQWITGVDARRDAHTLRAESDAIIVGAGTVRADDPSLTVRHVDAPRGDPLRIVLGAIPDGAKVLPARSYIGSIPELLDELGAQGVLQVLIEGGASVAHGFHSLGLVDKYVVYLAPVLFGGDDSFGMFTGPGSSTISDVLRGTFESVVPLGSDIRIDLVRNVTAVTGGSEPGEATTVTRAPLIE